MARIRTVKPEMAQDEDLAACSIEAQLLAVRLLNHADDEGYFKANTALVKAACFPLVDSLNIHGMLTELSKAGYLWLGKGSDEKTYGKIRTFTKHQKVNRPYPSKIKDLVKITEHSVSDHGTLTTGMEWEKDLKPYGSSDKPTNPTGYPPDFETIWHAYPKRNGSNPKKPTLSAYRQRLKEGVPHDDIAAGVQRYAAWCDATGKTGQETVMQAKRFLGPGREWENPWTAEAAVTLPKDAHELWDIRRRLDLPPFFDDVKSCHAEIRARLRERPELRAAL